MKTGKPNTRLSEKLNAELDTIRQEHAALMASQLKSFGNDLTSIAQHARNTIENDTRHFLQTNKSYFETRTKQIKRWTSISPWLTTGLALMVIALMMGLSWLWTSMLTSSELTQMGLTRIVQNEQTWLVMNPDKTALKNCTLASTPMLCIEIKER